MMITATQAQEAVADYMRDNHGCDDVRFLSERQRDGVFKQVFTFACVQHGGRSMNVWHVVEYAVDDVNVLTIVASPVAEFNPVVL